MGDGWIEMQWGMDRFGRHLFVFGLAQFAKSLCGGRRVSSLPQVLKTPQLQILNWYPAPAVAFRSRLAGLTPSPRGKANVSDRAPRFGWATWSSLAFWRSSTCRIARMVVLGGQTKWAPQ